jgi:amidase
LKPSLGRVPDLEPGRSISHQLLNVQGPMARQVADLRLALNVIGRFDDRDAWSTPALDAPAGAPKPRVAMLPLEGVASQVADGIEAAADLLRQAGYDVVDAHPPHLAEAAAIASRISVQDLRTTGDEVLGMMSKDARTHLDLMMELVGPVSDREYQQCHADRLAITEEWAQFQRRCPVILAPVATRPPFTHGADLHRAGLDEIMASMAPLLAVNALGLPAAVVPVGTGSGLPQVAQLIGPRHRDELCLDTAEAIEALAGPLSPIDPLGRI